MPYEPIIFEDKPARTTPINAAALAHMQTQYPRMMEDATALFGGAPIAKEGHKYRQVACTIRNTGSGWALINDAGHSPIGVTGVSVSGGFIRLALDFSATTVGGVVSGPDETFIVSGLDAAPSVALDSISLQIVKHGGNYDYVTWNGSAFVSTTGFVTSASINATTGVIRFEHAEVPEALAGTVELRTDGTNRGVPGGRTATSIDATVFPYNSATSLKTGTADMRFFINRTGARKITDPTTVTSATGNFWVVGILEVA